MAGPEAGTKPPVQGIGNWHNACRKNQLCPAVCVAVPKWMYARYTTERALGEARRAAFDAKVAQREAFMNSLEELGKAGYKSTYRPPSGAPRCYRTGEKVETCFYN